MTMRTVALCALVMTMAPEALAIRAKEPSGPVILDKIRVTGKLEETAVFAKLRPQQNALAFCWETAPPQKAKTLVAKFKLDAAGAMSGLSVTKTGNKEVDKCVASTLSGIAFDKPKGAGTVRLDIKYKPNPVVD